MSHNKDQYIDFEAYERATEPHKREKASAWRTAIGLQDVDGLRVSDYLKETAIKHIEGDITIDDVRKELHNYYLTKTSHDENDQDTEEADKVAANITKLLNEKSFSLKASEYLSIHRHIFEGVFSHAGEIRTYDISKKEWVLQGESVQYGRAVDIIDALNYDINEERQFKYANLSTDQIIEHIAYFTIMLWQNHPFREGNTRTTAVFIIKYLRSMGFEVNSELFADNSWYFRNALVRANYRNPSKGIEADKSFLLKFFRNLILKENNELKNRYMLINPSSDPSSRPSTDPQTESEHRTSSGQAQDKLYANNPNIQRLIVTIGYQELSVKNMMDAFELKGRDNFLNLYLKPAVGEGYVRLLYPNSPRHPRQKYLLTTKGLMAYNELKIKNKES